MQKDKFENIERFFLLVEKIARKYTKSKVEFEDLRQQGMIGLLEAFEAYNPEEKETFPAYAAKYIDGAIKHYLRDKASLIRYPRWFKILARRITQFVLKFKEDHNRPPTIKEISNALNIQESGVKEFFRVKELLCLQHFDDKEYEEGIDYNKLKAKIKHNTYESFKLPIEDVLTLYNAIDKLSDLKKKVIDHLFFQGYSQREAAKKIGISERHISRVKKDALNDLKGELKDFKDE